MVMQFLYIIQKFILKKCRKVTQCYVSSCWNNKPNSGVYNLIRTLKNQRHFRQGPQELLKWKFFLMELMELITQDIEIQEKLLKYLSG